MSSIRLNTSIDANVAIKTTYVTSDKSILWLLLLPTPSFTFFNLCHVLQGLCCPFLAIVSPCLTNRRRFLFAKVHHIYMLELDKSYYILAVEARVINLSFKWAVLQFRAQESQICLSSFSASPCATNLQNMSLC